MIIYLFFFKKCGIEKEYWAKKKSFYTLLV